jgi:hypothetical protein
VHVKVAVDSSAGGTAEIHAEVDAVWRVRIADRCLRLFGELHHFVGRLLARITKERDVLVRNDHQVTRSVRVNVEDDKIKLGTPEDEILLIGCRVGENGAKNTAVFNGCTARFYVVVSPRGPEYIHSLVETARGRSLVNKLDLLLNAGSVVLVDEFLELLAGLEIGNALCGNSDRVARLRITPFA